ncbi:MAG: 50S ribosomal protein L11 methyltransferase [Trueperaceae bacterium]|nr:50S ribosomal protein L11 methyltransferase [Trueperaceae bacterium]
MRHALRYPGAAPHGEGALGGELWDAGARAVAEDGDDLVAYFEAPTRSVPEGGTWERVDDRDYVSEYFAGLVAVSVGPLVIAPTHRSVTLDAGQRVLWLDPGMAFGTGHHETTRLVLEIMGEIPLAGARVLDIGAGSGVLAIAADLLGAAEANGIDIDADTIAVARANAALNRSRARFTCGAFDAAEVDGTYDVVVANLIAEAHVDLMSSYARVLRPHAVLVLSGIVDERVDMVEDAVQAPLTLIDRRRDGVWWALRLARSEGGG